MDVLKVPEAAKALGCTEACARAMAASRRILAKLEAAQRLRDALKILHDENMDYIKLNNLGAENNQSLRMAREALAAFDKEPR